VFPKGLKVGVIMSVERGAFGLYQHAVAEPSVDFGRIEEVLILPAGWPADATFEEATDASDNGASPETQAHKGQAP